MSKLNSNNNHKLGMGISRRMFHVKNIQKNLSNILLQVARDKGINIDNIEEEPVNNPIIVELNSVIKESEELYSIIQEKEPIVLNASLQASCNLMVDTLFHCGSIQLTESGVYSVSAQVGIQSKKTGMLSYMQYGLSHNDDVNKSCYNSNVMNTSLEKGYNVVSNISHIVTVNEPMELNLWLKVGYLSGSFSFDTDSSKLIAVKL